MSLLAGATPGIHFPHSQNYLRRVRLSSSSNILVPLKQAGYQIEEDQMSGPSTMVVSVPVSFDKRIKTVQDVNIKK